MELWQVRYVSKIYLIYIYIFSIYLIHILNIFDIYFIYIFDIYRVAECQIIYTEKTLRLLPPLELHNFSTFSHLFTRVYPRDPLHSATLDIYLIHFISAFKCWFDKCACGAQNHIIHGTSAKVR